jgi:filamentous hemagglutinin family protein
MACHPRPPALWSRCLWALLLSSALLLGVLRGSSKAQITLDGSLGLRGPLQGPNYRISAELGQIRGSNLFHSFGEFNVSPGGSATFAGPTTIANIVSRVTGGQPSSIDGVLRSEIAGANLYLLNPSGVMFGPNASLDVSGSFHVSTADFLRFADGATFAANLGQESVLTVASPTAFGFLGSNPVGITIRGSSLQVSEGKALSVVGGDVQIVGGKLVAPSGRIQTASAASPGEVIFSPLELAPDLRVDSFARLGRLEIAQGALLDASGVSAAGGGGPGGTVLIRSGRLLVDRSSILANTMGDVHGASLGLDLLVAADAVIRDSDLRASPSAAGNGGNIVMNAGRLTLTDGGRILSSSRGAGRGGTLTVAATEAISITGRNRQGNQSGLFSNAFSLGDAGRVFVSTPTLTMDDGDIQAGTVTRSRGNAGGAEVRVGRLTLSGGAQIDSSTSGVGRGGEVTVVATEAISIAGHDREDIRIRSGLFSTANASGDAGRLFVSAPLLESAGGRILGRTLGGGHAGDIELRVGRLTLTEGAQIFNGTGTAVSGGVIGQEDGLGRGGNLTVGATDSIFIAGHDQQGFQSGLFSSAQIGRGDAGNLFIATPVLTLDDGGAIAANALSSSRGSGGNIDVRAGRLTLSGGARISTSTFGSGGAGNLTATATEAISISERFSGGFETGLFSSTNGSGDAGHLFVSAPTLSLDGGGIRAGTLGDGNAGSVEVRVGRLTLTGGGQISSATGFLEFVDGVPTFRGTGGPGRGGDVTVVATESISIAGRDSEGFRSALGTNAHFGQGRAGNLFIATPSLTMDDGLILASTEGASSGDAGNLLLEVERLTMSGGARISTSTDGSGRGGELRVVATEAISIMGQDRNGFPSGLFSTAGGGGLGGSIHVQARAIELSDEGTISARSTGDGAAGTLLLQAGETFRSRHGHVITATDQAGGGAIALTAGRLVQLQDSEVTTSVRGGAADAGNLALDAPFVVADGSAMVANAFGGRGGNILINAGVFLRDPASLVSASSALGIQGTVNIQAPVTSLSGTLAPLPQAVVSAAALLPARCAARLSGGRYSSLVLGGRDGLPAEPSGVLPSPLALDERLVADPAVTGAPHRQKSAARFALLPGHEKGLPRLGCPP